MRPTGAVALLAIVAVQGCRCGRSLPKAQSTAPSASASSAAHGASAARDPSAWKGWPLSHAPAVSGDGDIGSAGPTTHLLTDPKARWIVLCQATTDTDGDGELSVVMGYHGERVGDALASYIVVGDGAAESIGDVLGASDDGRLLALARGGRTMVLDFETGRALEIRDLRDVEYSTSRVFAVRGPLNKTFLESYDLSTGVPRTLPHGTGLVSQFAGPPGASWLAIAALPSDSDGDGRIELGSVRSMHSWRCGGPSATGRAGPSVAKGDQTVRRLVRRDGSKVIDGAYLQPFGDALIEERGSKGVVLIRDGKRTRIAPPECHPVVLFRDPARGAVLIACGGGMDARHMLLWKPDGTRRLELKVFTMQKTKPGSRWVAVASMEKRDGLVDLDEGTMRTLDLDEHVVLIHGQHALLARAAKLSWLDLKSGDRRALGSTASRSADATSPPFAAISGNVVDVEHGKVVGHYAGPAAAVDATGRVLLAESHGQFGVGNGPYHWRRAH